MWFEGIGLIVMVYDMSIILLSMATITYIEFTGLLIRDLKDKTSDLFSRKIWNHLNMFQQFSIIYHKFK